MPPYPCIPNLWSPVIRLAERKYGKRESLDLHGFGYGRDREPKKVNVTTTRSLSDLSCGKLTTRVYHLSRLSFLWFRRGIKSYGRVLAG
jgi:hypothetical protein